MEHINFISILSYLLVFGSQTHVFCSRFPVFCKHITVSAYLNIVANITGLCSATTPTTILKVGRSEELQFRNCLNLITYLHLTSRLKVELYLYSAINLNGLHGTTVTELRTAPLNIPVRNKYTRVHAHTHTHARARARAHTRSNGAAWLPLFASDLEFAYNCYLVALTRNVSSRSGVSVGGMFQHSVTFQTGKQTTYTDQLCKRPFSKTCIILAQRFKINCEATLIQDKIWNSVPPYEMSFMYTILRLWFSYDNSSYINYLLNSGISATEHDGCNLALIPHHVITHMINPLMYP
jgi:hypothetical protein